VPTPPALHEPGKDRNQFIPFQSRSAAHAVRGSRNDALLPRYPEYADIQEGSDTKAKGECEDEDEGIEGLHVIRSGGGD
jgi:hypothetical protein